MFFTLIEAFITIFETKIGLINSEIFNNNFTTNLLMNQYISETQMNSCLVVFQIIVNTQTNAADFGW